MNSAQPQCPTHDSDSLTFLVRVTTERILSSAALAQGLCTFFSQDYFYSPSCQWVSVEHGAHTERETCRVTLHWAWPAWYLSHEQGLPPCPLPLLPGRVSLGEAYWCQQLLGTTGRPHPRLSSLHLQERPSGHVCHQTTPSTDISINVTPPDQLSKNSKSSV